MNPKHIVSLLQGAYTTVEVRFEPVGKLYTYKTRLKLVKGDWVIVVVNHVVKVVEVVNVHAAPRIDFDAPYDYKWIVQKVDFANYNKILEEEEGIKHHLDTLDRLQKRSTLLEIFDKTYPTGSKARDYWLTKIKPLLKD